MGDLINGRELLKSLQVYLCFGIACKDCTMRTEDGGCRVEEWIDKFPSVDIPQSDDWEKYSDRLWKLAYERGKASVRPQGEWIWDKDGMDWNIGAWICSECHARNANLPDYKKIIPLRMSGSKFCPNCGAYMKRSRDELVE